MTFYKIVEILSVTSHEYKVKKSSARRVHISDVKVKCTLVLVLIISSTSHLGLLILNFQMHGKNFWIKTIFDQICGNFFFPVIEYCQNDFFSLLCLKTFPICQPVCSQIAFYCKTFKASYASSTFLNYWNILDTFKDLIFHKLPFPWIVWWLFLTCRNMLV